MWKPTSLLLCFHSLQYSLLVATSSYPDGGYRTIWELHTLAVINSWCWTFNNLDTGQYTRHKQKSFTVSKSLMLSCQSLEINCDRIWTCTQRQPAVSVESFCIRAWISSGILFPWEHCKQTVFTYSKKKHMALLSLTEVVLFLVAKQPQYMPDSWRVWWPSPTED